MIKKHVAIILEENYYMQDQLNMQDSQTPLPNGTSVLVLGILSILGCCCYGIVGLVLGIIALVLANKDTQLYNTNPAVYSLKSWKNLRAGKICAIIGLVLSVLSVIYFIFIITVVGVDALTSGDPQQILDALEDLK